MRVTFADSRVYPRVCGGTQPGHCKDCLLAGLSPRVRGNHDGERILILLTRSIPACAGEPGFRYP